MQCVECSVRSVGCVTGRVGWRMYSAVCGVFCTVSGVCSRPGGLQYVECSVRAVGCVAGRVDCSMWSVLYGQWGV